MIRRNMDANYADSTWEDMQPPKKKRKQQHGNTDMQNYSHGYGKSYLDTAIELDSPGEMPNLLFYQNRIQFEPHGIRIEDIHHYWWGDYQELEENHSYIQWLFPLREPGVNPCARPLTLAEIRMMRADEDVMQRLFKSYKIMLGFYGISLLDEKTGKVSRAKNWKERYHNLNRRSHNNLRITRILKCLGEMGYDHLQAPLVQFFLEETLCNNQLPNVKRSVLDYFMFAVKDKQKHKKLVHFAREIYKSQGPFICGPEEKLRNLTPKKQKENEGDTEEMEDNETLSPHHNDLYHHPQQETRTGGDMGANGRLGAGRTRDHEVSTHKGGMPSSRHDKQTIQDYSSGNRKLITEDNSSGNKKNVTESFIYHNKKLTGNKKLLRQGPRKGNEWLTTAKTSFGNNKTPWCANQENKTQKKKPGMFPAENEERHNLLSGTLDAIKIFFKVTFLFCLVFLAIFCTTFFLMMHTD